MRREINKIFMEKFWKVYSEEHLKEKDTKWKPYPLNEEICNFITNYIENENNR